LPAPFHFRPFSFFVFFIFFFCLFSSFSNIPLSAFFSLI
jgi:hypothetical protein